MIKLQFTALVWQKSEQDMVGIIQDVDVVEQFVLCSFHKRYELRKTPAS